MLWGAQSIEYLLSGLSDHRHRITRGSLGTVKFEDYYTGWKTLTDNFFNFCESITRESS
jgi:hypothetical protein